MIVEGWGGAEGEICWFGFLNNFFQDTDVMDSTVEYRIIVTVRKGWLIGGSEKGPVVHGGTHILRVPGCSLSLLCIELRLDRVHALYQMVRWAPRLCPWTDTCLLRVWGSCTHRRHGGGQPEREPGRLALGPGGGTWQGPWGRSSQPYSPVVHIWNTVYKGATYLHKGK